VSETVEFGGWRPPPRWVRALAVAAGVALLAWVIVTRTGPHGTASSSRSKAPATSPARASVTWPEVPWPAAPGACDSPVSLPRIQVAREGAGVRGRLLVGGAALREIGPGRAVSRPLSGLAGRGLLVTKLVVGPDADYALAVRRCSGQLRVYRIVAGAAYRLRIAADSLLGGPHHAWAVSYSRHTVLTPLNGGRTVTLKARTEPVADTVAGLVVVAYDQRAAAPYTVELVNPDSGALVRRLATGWPIGAAGGIVLVRQADCGAPLTHSACALKSIDLGTGRQRAMFELPPGRAPVSTAVFSRNGGMAAFQLAWARKDPRFPTVLPPADVVVLDLRTGRLDKVPGLELPPETQAGLTFDAAGSWLLATVSEGDRGELLAWRPGMPGLAGITVLPGPLVAAPPLLTARTW
jgi:hypothetical protein